MPKTASTQTRFIKVSSDFAIYLSTNEELPPTLCPELIPQGWDLYLEDGLEQVVDFKVAGEFVEAYILRRLRFNHDHL